MPLTAADLRPQVLAFALAMEERLRANDHKGGWLHMPNGTICSRIKQEHTEFLVALATKDPVQILHEAADVGNFYMMACQNNHALGEANSAPCWPKRAPVFNGSDKGLTA